MKTAFTIATGNYLAQAKTVADSFVHHNPAYEFVICLLDRSQAELDLQSLGYKIIEASQLGIPVFNDIVNRYDIFELSNAMKPFFAEYLMKDKEVDVLIYLDSDMMVFGSVSVVEHALKSHDICLTPHVLSSIPNDGHLPNETAFLNCGIYNAGFVALTNSKEAIRFIEWWKIKLEWFCFHKVCEGMYVDQLWLNFVPLYFSSLKIIDDPGYNMAYYNLHERTLSKSEAGFLVNGKSRLVIYHFTGYDLSNADDISRYQNRYSFSTRPDLVGVYHAYADALRINKLFYYKFFQSAYAVNRPVVTQQVKRRQLTLFERVNARKRIMTVQRIMLGIVSQKLTLLRRSVQYRTKNLLQTLRGAFNSTKEGLNLVGYFSYTSGVAEVGRFFAHFVSRTETSFDIVDVQATAYKKLDSGSLANYSPYFRSNPRYNRNIFFINADALVPFNQNFKFLFIRRYNIGVFFWEFNDYFNFPRALALVDEVVVFSDFIASAVKKAAPMLKVTKLHFPFVKNWEITASRQEIRKELGVRDDEFVFIFNFDFLSVYQRKNPEALLRAFEKAFSINDKVRLILKTINGKAGSNNFIRFENALKSMGLRDKVVAIHDNLERSKFMSVINASDCYISLHRSEGLGLGMLEAMSMGKPVIATKFGGNTDFMNEGNSILIDYKLVPLVEEEGPYKAGWLWAEPSVFEAAKSMKHLYADKAFAQAIGQRAYEYVQQTYSDKVISEAFKRWTDSLK